MHHTNRTAFSLPELLVSLAILAIVGGLSISTFVNFSRESAVEATTQVIVSQLRQAQNQTLTLLNGNQYGVHITSTSSTLFVGSTYQSMNASNTLFAFGTNISVSASPSDYVFQKLSGTTTSGTINVHASSNQSISSTISVATTGTAQLQ